MSRAVARAVIGSLLLVLVAGGAAVGQQPQTDDLKKDMDSLKKMLEAMQKDLQEIKGMLARQGGPRSVVGVVLDLATNPFKGEQTAALTLVEFSDYQ